MKKPTIFFAALAALTMVAPSNAQGIRKIKDVVIYRDTMYFSSFPSALVRPDGEVWVSFRRAPDRRTTFAEPHNTHVDPNSYMVMVRSDDGEHWSEEPELIYAHPQGGSQDPCFLQLRDGAVLCASYLWAFVRQSGMEHLERPYLYAGNGAVFQGGYLVRTTDGGRHWSEPIYPADVPCSRIKAAIGDKLPAYNRGALCEALDGRILWAVPSFDNDALSKTSVHLMQSLDKGLTWEYVAPIARDDKASFNETSVYQTPSGAIVAFLRSENFGDNACIARSTDGGKTFVWESMGFQGHPLNALRLPDNRVLLTYGYRHPPFGIRARILNAECTDFDTAEEVVLRDDGGDGDLGYTWPVKLKRNRYLIVYYMNHNAAKGTRYIGGTIVEIDKTHKR